MFVTFSMLSTLIYLLPSTTAKMSTFTALVSFSHISSVPAYTSQGRTARIGNKGLATSFYNDDDESLAAFLVKTLMECGQEVPDFLEAYKPAEGEPIEWNDDSGVESGNEVNENAGEADDGGAWGGGESSTIVAATTPDGSGEAWGTNNGGESGSNAW
jgi:ATP-dependent RNA helicase DDX3X